MAAAPTAIGKALVFTLANLRIDAQPALPAAATAPSTPARTPQPRAALCRHRPRLVYITIRCVGRCTFARWHCPRRPRRRRLPRRTRRLHRTRLNSSPTPSRWMSPPSPPLPATHSLPRTTRSRSRRPAPAVTPKRCATSTPPPGARASTTIFTFAQRVRRLPHRQPQLAPARRSGPQVPH